MRDIQMLCKKWRNKLINDFLIYIGGFISGILAAMLSGFFKAAGSDAYQTAKKKLYPPEAEPIQVERDFVPESTAGASYSWVPAASVITKESAGYQYYLHPNKGEKCFRISGGNQDKEWLMRKPSI